MKQSRAEQKRRPSRRPWVVYALIASGAGTVGFLVGHVGPHLIAGDQFWHDFITGPPAAGLFAVFAALIAFGAAAWTARGARENAELAAREVRSSAETAERWKRIEWSLEKALSADDDVAAAGFASCEALIRSQGCTVAEIVMLKAAVGMDDDESAAENGNDTAGGDRSG